MTELPLGEFPLITAECDIDSAYQNDQEIEIRFAGTGMNIHSLKGVLRFKEILNYRGHSTEPEGYRLVVSRRRGSASLWLAITSRPSNQEVPG